MKVTLIPIKTRLITSKDSISNIIDTFARRNIRSGDIVVIAESPLAITQGRAVNEDTIRVGIVARLLWKRVAKVPYGVGLRSPKSMQCAVNESGAIRIIIAALFSAITKPFGIKGIFYRIAGKKTAMIDAAHTTPVEPFDKCVILGPDKPDAVAQRLKKEFGIEFAVMDINDIGGSWVIGSSGGVPRKTLEKVMKINPLGQGLEMTPLCIVRGLLCKKEKRE
jgi:F420-0:gamma-glutamyl ligase